MAAERDCHEQGRATLQLEEDLAAAHAEIERRAAGERFTAQLLAGRQGRRLRPPEELIGAYYEHPGRTMKYLCLAYGDEKDAADSDD